MRYIEIGVMQYKILSLSVCHYQSKSTFQEGDLQHSDTKVSLNMDFTSSRTKFKISTQFIQKPHKTNVKFLKEGSNYER